MWTRTTVGRRLLSTLAVLEGQGTCRRGTGRVKMSELSPAVHRAIVCVDVEGFGDRRRTNLDQVAARDGLYYALDRAFARSEMSWDDCYHEDRGDGALIL